MGVQGRSLFSRKAATLVTRAKQFKTYAEQVGLLRARGMCVDDQVRAEHLLARLNYYRLSGYWYPMRRFTLDTGIAKDKFVDGASFDLVVALYEFDERLRHCVFIEIAWRWPFGPCSATSWDVSTRWFTWTQHV